MIARHADRAGSDNEGSICHGAVGDEEHGGGSKRYLFWVLRRRDQDFQQEVGHVRRARSGQTKEVVLTAVGQPRRSANMTKTWMTIFSFAAGTVLAADPNMVRVAAIQCHSEMGAIEANTTNIVELVRQASIAGAKIIVLPECSIQGYLQPDSWTSWSLDPQTEYAVSQVAESIPGKTTALMAKLTDELNIYLCFGIIETDGKAFYNSQILLDPKGQIVGHHRKKTLWTPGDSAWCTEGNLPLQVIDTEFGKIGMMICFDFHTLPIKLAKMGANIVVYSIGWYGPNEDHWFKDVFPSKVIIPNGFSVIGANWTGRTPEDEWPGRGHSFVATSDGTIVSMAKTDVGNEIVMADIPISHPRQNKAVKVQNPAAGF